MLKRKKWDEQSFMHQTLYWLSSDPITTSFYLIQNSLSFPIEEYTTNSDEKENSNQDYPQWKDTIDPILLLGLIFQVLKPHPNDGKHIYWFTKKGY